MGVKKLFHVTYLNRLDPISEDGLVARSARSIGGSAYDDHASKGIFLTDGEGVSHWYGKSQDWADDVSDDLHGDGYVSVVLRVDPPSEMIDDEIANDETYYSNFISVNNIDPEGITVWSGKEWIPVSQWGDILPEDGLTSEYYEGETLWYADPDAKLNPANTSEFSLM